MADPELANEAGSDIPYERHRDYAAAMMLKEAERKRTDQENRLDYFRKTSAAIAAAHLATSSTVVGLTVEPQAWATTLVAVSVVGTTAFAAWINSPIQGWNGGMNIGSMDETTYCPALPPREIDRSLAIKMGTDFVSNEILIASRLKGYAYLLASALVGYVALIASTA